MFPTSITCSRCTGAPQSGHPSPSCTSCKSVNSVSQSSPGTTPRRWISFLFAPTTYPRFPAGPRGVVPGEDWETEFTDLHEVQDGEGCPDCGAPVHLEQVIEVGNIFKLGTRYSEPLGATVLGEDGKERPLVMGSYGIGPARVAAAAVEQNHDDDGICWPRAIAPFDVYMVTVKMEDEKQRELSQELYTRMTEEGWECLWDDRQERAGVKYKDAELIGCPVRITVGRGATDGLVELGARVGKEREDVPVDRLMARMQEVWQAAP